MIVRRLVPTLFLFYGALYVNADTPFDCKITLENIKFDLTKLTGEHVANRTRETPPSTVIDSLRFDLCNDLKSLDAVPEYDQCPTGSRACLTQIVQKKDQADLIASVIPLAQTSKLEQTFSYNMSPKSVSILFHGAEYPPNPPSSSQSLSVTILCDPQDTSEPKILSYNGTVLELEWSAPAGCPFQEGEEGEKEPEKDQDPPKTPEEVGSGLGWFFLVLFLAFVAYFGLGAYYNYSTYGASGTDLIPHRDFWKEVPYMLKDVISHLCSNVRPRRTATRGGYISV